MSVRTAYRSIPGVGTLRAMFSNKIAGLVAAGMLASGFYAMASESLADPAASTRYTYYTVSGTTAAELYRSMLSKGPRVRGIKSFANTTAKTLKKGHLVDGGSCRVDGFAMKIEFVTQLPQAANEGALSATDRALWRQFVADVKAHEATHRSIWMDCTAAIERQTRALRTASCGEFNRKVEQIWSLASASCMRRHSTFEKSEQARLLRLPFIRQAKGQGTRTSALNE